MTAPYSDLDDRAHKTMAGELVSAVGGGRAASTLLAAFTPNGTPFSEARLSGYSNLSDMTRFMPSRMITKLEIAAGAPLFSRWMTERVMREAGAAAGKICVQDLCRILHEAGDLQSTLGDAVADGQVDSAERAALRSCITDLELVLRDLRAKVEQP